MKAQCCKDCILWGVPLQHVRFYRKRLWTCICGLRNVPLKSAAPKSGRRVEADKNKPQAPVESFKSSVFSPALPDTKLEAVLAAFCLLLAKQKGRDLLKFSWQVFAFIPGSTTGKPVECESPCTGFRKQETKSPTKHSAEGPSFTKPHKCLHWAACDKTPRGITISSYCWQLSTENQCWPYLDHIYGHAQHDEQDALDRISHICTIIPSPPVPCCTLNSATRCHEILTWNSILWHY